eukprot:CAMPEP_0176245216 /NCGR_PEP_ID=MMETSP0121_2-20121125/31829_1 /TAXON_ID=160619 /ORGANISM="Kryptoperidinium foliaceum, Strain CCMP 1326" /LENGTH=192 /DNA_ID=CAMNT_0017584841 /DNA_START=200 /DNA_END=778 /DNA_ORIENTATION=-
MHILPSAREVMRPANGRCPSDHRRRGSIGHQRGPPLWACAVEEDMRRSCRRQAWRGALPLPLRLARNHPPDERGDALQPLRGGRDGRRQLRLGGVEARLRQRPLHEAVDETMEALAPALSGAAPLRSRGVALCCVLHDLGARRAFAPRLRGRGAATPPGHAVTELDMQERVLHHDAERRHICRSRASVCECV